MKYYMITDYLAPKWRRAMAEAKYPNTGRTSKQRLTEDDRCPFGVLDLGYGHDKRAPDGETVARALFYTTAMDEDTDPEEWLEVVGAMAQEFIDDWDDGLIRPEDLAVALGIH